MKTVFRIIIVVSSGILCETIELLLEITWLPFIYRWEFTSVTWETAKKTSVTWETAKEKEAMAFSVIYEKESTTGMISTNKNCTQKTYKNDTWYDTDLISIKQHATTMSVAMIIMLTDNHYGTEAKLMNIIWSQFSAAFLPSFLWQPCHDDCHQGEGIIFCAFFGDWTVIMEYCIFLATKPFSFTFSYTNIQLKFLQWNVNKGAVERFHIN